MERHKTHTAFDWELMLFSSVTTEGRHKTRGSVTGRDQASQTGGINTMLNDRVNEKRRRYMQTSRQWFSRTVRDSRVNKRENCYSVSLLAVRLASNNDHHDEKEGRLAKEEYSSSTVCVPKRRLRDEGSSEIKCRPWRFYEQWTLYSLSSERPRVTHEGHKSKDPLLRHPLFLFVDWTL